MTDPYSMQSNPWLKMDTQEYEKNIYTSVSKMTVKYMTDI